MDFLKRAGLTLGCLLLWCGSSAACLPMANPLAPGVHGSVALPHRGSLSDGAALPSKGPGFRRYRSDAIRWGHPRLVGAIERAAAAVASQRPGGSDLVVADLSARRGGKIPRHRSHRSGRDVDLLFYTVTPDGRSLRNPGFLHFGRDGLALANRRTREYVRLDVDRTWLLVKALINDPQAHVQWLFSARWLEALLIEHAIALGEDPQLIWRAENLLRQPGDSFPHDDHIHMRIACTPADKVAGCISGGYHWPWLPKPPSVVAPSDAELLAALLDDDDSGPQP